MDRRDILSTMLLLGAPTMCRCIINWNLWIEQNCLCLLLLVSGCKSGRSVLVGGGGGVHLEVWKCASWLGAGGGRGGWSGGRGGGGGVDKVWPEWYSIRAICGIPSTSPCPTVQVKPKHCRRTLNVRSLSHKQTFYRNIFNNNNKKIWNKIVTANLPEKKDQKHTRCLQLLIPLDIALGCSTFGWTSTSVTVQSTWNIRER